MRSNRLLRRALLLSSDHADVAASPEVAADRRLRADPGCGEGGLEKAAAGRQASGRRAEADGRYGDEGAVEGVHLGVLLFHVGRLQRLDLGWGHLFETQGRVKKSCWGGTGVYVTRTLAKGLKRPFCVNTFENKSNRQLPIPRQLFIITT